MTISQVRVLSITHVHPDHRTSNIDPSLVPAVDHTIKLSFLDSFHVATGAIQRLFFYEGPDLPPFPSILSSLRSSLAVTLPVFLPLAGKLAYRPSSGDVVVDCTPSAVSSGVKFVEAEFSDGADAMRRLAAADDHDTETFARLVPVLDDDGKLPAPLLAVQVTRPAGTGGGMVAVGVSVHHAVADGKSFWQFMRWWSAASHGDSLTEPAGLVPPAFDRTAIRHPRAEELTAGILRLRAPMLPMLGRSSSGTAADTARRRSRTFLLSADQIQSLKGRISRELPKPVSAYVSISSLAWTCIVVAKLASKMIHINDEVYLMVNADCRGRLHGPSIDEGFFGNCVRPCYARARAGDLTPHPPGGDVDGLALVHSAAAIQEAIRQGVEAPAENPFDDIWELMEYHMALPPGRVSTVGSSHRFMAYETDFGWGAPSRVELVSVFGNAEMVALLGARNRGVQVTVSLDEACMDVFAASFLGVAKGC